jgi:hypothetical protein
MNTNKKEKMQELAGILRETDKPLYTRVLVGELGISKSTLMRYIAELPTYLNEDEKLNVTPGRNGENMYTIIEKNDKYDSSKTEGGYMDPTAAAAMATYDSTVKDWKYNIGDIWYSENSKHQLDPFLIIAIYSEKALLLRVYDHSDVIANKIDLNDPNFVVNTDHHLVADTSYICTKPYKWLANKDVRTFDDAWMDEIRRKIAKSMHITDAALGEEYTQLQAQLETAHASIEELSKTVDWLNEEKKALKEQLDMVFAKSANQIISGDATAHKDRNPYGDYDFSDHKEDFKQFEKDLHLSEPVEKRILEMQNEMLEAERDRLYDLLCGVCANAR